VNRAHALRIEGELTIYCAQDVRQRLVQALAALEAGDAPALEVDLSAVSEADTAGMQLLMAARRHARARGRDLRLSACSAAAAEVIGLLGLGPYFDLPAAGQGDAGGAPA